MRWMVCWSEATGTSTVSKPKEGLGPEPLRYRYFQSGLPHILLPICQVYFSCASSRSFNEKSRPLAVVSCRAQTLAVHDSVLLRRAIPVLASAPGAGVEHALKKLTAAS